jgi:hypothetical protein
MPTSVRPTVILKEDLVCFTKSPTFIIQENRYVNKGLFLDNQGLHS